MVDITIIWSSSLVLDCWNSSNRSGVCWGYSPTWYHVHRRQVWWYSRNGLEDYLSERRPDCVWSDDTRKAGWPASIQLLARQVILCAFCNVPLLCKMLIKPIIIVFLPYWLQEFRTVGLVSTGLGAVVYLVYLWKTKNPWVYKDIHEHTKDMQE